MPNDAMDDAQGTGHRLETIVTKVDGLNLFAHVFTTPAPTGGPTVVLVHGVIASSRYMLPTAIRLAPYGRVYVPDLPGYGRSGKPARALEVPELADSLVTWLRRLHLERATFVGNSFGCQVVADLAARHPACVDRVVLFGPTVDPSARGMLHLGLRLLRDAPRERLSLLPIQGRDLLRLGPARAYGAVQAMLRDHIEDKLPFVRAPTLVVRGGRDPLVSQRWVEEMVRLLPAGSQVTIPDAPHAANYSAPTRLVEVIAPFIAPFIAQGPERT
jgi:2-hydroxy-6-oxonona-2,4-dienedioate hydrolase